MLSFFINALMNSECVCKVNDFIRFCCAASSQSSIRSQTSPEEPRKHPPHKTHSFENWKWNYWLQVHPKFGLLVFKHPAQDKHWLHSTFDTNTWIFTWKLIENQLFFVMFVSFQLPKQHTLADHPCRAQKIPPSPNSLFVWILIDTVDYRFTQNSAFWFSNTCWFKSITYRLVQIHYIQASANTLHTG